jgi:hypothetical protein
MAARKKSSGAQVLRNVVTSAAATETILDLVDRLGLVDIVMGRLKSKIEETDLDELLDEVRDYLKSNPDVLVVGLAAITLATGALVYMNQRREWDGDERRGVEKPARTTTGRIRKAS